MFKPAYLVHLLTASGVMPAALAVRELVRTDCDPRVVFVYLLLTTFIDAIDGPFARRFNVTDNKDETGGVFRGFPSYWNLYAIYAGAFSIKSVRG